MFDNLKIAALKRTAGKHYEAYHHLCDQMSCGANMAAIISRDVYHHASKFNKAMDELAKIDPSAPSYRLDEGK